MRTTFKPIFFAVLILTATNAFAQVGIGTNTPAASAALEVSSSTNNKGILIPRITVTQKDAISNPAQGLLVYQTTAPIGFYYYTGTAWKLMVTQTDLDTKVSTVDATISLNTKVDKVIGKELSSNDFTTLEKTKLAAITGTNTGDQDLSALATTASVALKANTTDVSTNLALKVDKVIGKELSSNDYTTVEKTNLAVIIGTYTGDQTNITANTAKVGFTDALVSANADVVANTAKVGITNGTAAGQMMYWNGNAWVVIATTANLGAALQMIVGVPTWVGGTPPTVPDAPTIGTATGGDAQATVAFTAPASNGGAAITTYTATSNPGNITGTVSQAASGTITVTGLTNGTAYTFAVTATNSLGTGAASVASNSVTPVGAPDAPTIGTATGGDAQATVAFTAPASDGGAAITTNYYWSSTEVDGNLAWIQNFLSGVHYNYNKSTTYNVRAVRAF